MKRLRPVSCHELPENDNTSQDMIVKEWTRGRTRRLRGSPGRLQARRPASRGRRPKTRGGKAKTDAARIVRVVNRMSEAEGAAADIEHPWQYLQKPSTTRWQTRRRRSITQIGFTSKEAANPR